jgi:hypothetical protein
VDRGFPAPPAALRLAVVLRGAVERFGEGVGDPAEEEPVASRKPRGRGKGMTH